MDLNGLDCRSLSPSIEGSDNRKRKRVESSGDNQTTMSTVVQVSNQLMLAETQTAATALNLSQPLSETNKIKRLMANQSMTRVDLLNLSEKTHLQLVEKLDYNIVKSISQTYKVFKKKALTLLREKIESFGFDQFAQILSVESIDAYQKNLLLNKYSQINQRLNTNLELKNFESALENFADDLLSFEGQITQVCPSVGYPLILYNDKDYDRSVYSKLVDWIRKIRLLVEVERATDMESIFKGDGYDPVECKLDLRDVHNLQKVYHYALYNGHRDIFLNAASTRMDRDDQLKLVRLVTQSFECYETNVMVLERNTEFMSESWLTVISQERANTLEIATKIIFGNHFNDSFDFIQSDFVQEDEVSSEDEGSDAKEISPRKLFASLLYLWSKHPTSESMAKLFENLDLSKKYSLVFSGLSELIESIMLETIVPYDDGGKLVDCFKFLIDTLKVAKDQNFDVDDHLDSIYRMLINAQTILHEQVLDKIDETDQETTHTGCRIYSISDSELWEFSYDLVEEQSKLIKNEIVKQHSKVLNLDLVVPNLPSIQDNQSGEFGIGESLLS